jgi:hypothetical protein
MTIRKTLLATAALVTMTIAGAATASAAPMHRSAMHPAAHTQAALTIQLHAPAPQRLRDNRIDRRPIVSDRVILANLRAHNYRALGKPHFVRGHLVVEARGRFGRIVMVEVSPRTGRIIGVIRI